MIDTGLLPASIMQTSGALLGIYAVLYVLSVRDGREKEDLEWLNAMFKLVIIISLAAIFLSTIWLVISPKILILGFFGIQSLVLSCFFIELFIIFIYSLDTISFLREGGKTVPFFRKLAMPYILLFVVISFLSLALDDNYEIFFYFFIFALIALNTLRVYPGFHFKQLRVVCKILDKRKEKDLFICHRCMGIYCGLFFSLLSGLLFHLFISDIRQIDLPTNCIIVISGILFSLNAIQGVLRRLNYPLFSWDNVPGSDSERLLWYIRNVLNIDWVENAEISKSNDCKTIFILKDENSAKIMIDEEKEKVTIKINDKLAYALELKKEGGKLNIYKYTNLIFFTSDISAFILGFLFGLFTFILGFLFGTSTAVYPI